MPFQPIDLGKIRGQQMQNALAARQLDPNSLQNQLLRAQIGKAQSPGSRLKIAPLSTKEHTVESIAEAMRSGDISGLERYIKPDAPYRVDTGIATEFWAVPRGTMTPVLVKTIPHDPEKAAGLAAKGRTEATLRAQSGEGGAPSAADVAGEKQQAVSDVDLTMQPKITEAKETVKAGVKERVLAAKNTRAYKTFEIGINKMSKAFAGTITGPLLGLGPAVTAPQQMALASVATMAPLLKSLFREAGEGIFTDKDQELLLAMAPSRTDHAEVAQQKIQDINEIVRSKLGMPSLNPESVPASNNQTDEDNDPLGIR